MALEIERKFLIKDDSWRAGSRGLRYVQGYISSRPERTVRVRLVGERGFLTVKGKTRGTARSEFEYEIPAVDAEQMLFELCEKPLIEKTRYEIEHGGMTWEVDEFLGENEGLIIAELELEREDQAIGKPDWVGQEVTGDPKYFNSSLVKAPFRSWGR